MAAMVHTISLTPLAWPVGRSPTPRQHPTPGAVTGRSAAIRWPPSPDPFGGSVLATRAAVRPSVGRHRPSARQQSRPPRCPLPCSCFAPAAEPFLSVDEEADGEDAATAAEAAAWASYARRASFYFSHARSAQGRQQQLLSQGSQEWHAERSNRLTASSVPDALGTYTGLVGRSGRTPRAKLYYEKLGLVEKWAGNAATAYGTAQEPLARRAYQTITGEQ